MPSDYWTASDYLATIASDYPATIRHTRGRGSLDGAAPVFAPQGRSGTPPGGLGRPLLGIAGGGNTAERLAFAQKRPLNRFYYCGREKYRRK